MAARNNFAGLDALQTETMKRVTKALEAPTVSPLPPAIDVQARYADVPARASPFDDASAELDDLTGVALHKLREIVEYPTDWDQLRLVQVQASAAAQILNVQIRVDEGRLRRRKVDILPKLLELIAAEEGKLAQRALVIEATALD